MGFTGCESIRLKGKKCTCEKEMMLTKKKKDYFLKTCGLTKKNMIIKNLDNNEDIRDLLQSL